MTAEARVEGRRQAEARVVMLIGEMRVGAAQAARRVFDWAPLPDAEVTSRALNDEVTAHALAAVGRAFGPVLLPLVLWGETLRDHHFGRPRAGRTQRVVEVFVPFELIVGRAHLDLVLVRGLLHLCCELTCAGASGWERCCGAAGGDWQPAAVRIGACV